MTLRSKKPILICIDIQLAFLEEDSWGGNRNNKNAEEICAKIIARWRGLGEEIIHIRHSSSNPKSSLHKNAKGFSFNPLCAPINGEVVVTKSVNSCFIGTNLKKILDEKKWVVNNSELQRVPVDTTTLDLESAQKVMKLIDKMEEDDDVNAVYHNLEITEELINSI